MNVRMMNLVYVVHLYVKIYWGTVKHVATIHQTRLRIVDFVVETLDPFAFKKANKVSSQVEGVC